jgi:hypothetical protein
MVRYGVSSLIKSRNSDGSDGSDDSDDDGGNLEGDDYQYNGGDYEDYEYMHIIGLGRSMTKSLQYSKMYS